MQTILVILDQHGAPQVISNTADEVCVIFLEPSELATTDVQMNGSEYTATSAVSTHDAKLIENVRRQYTENKAEALPAQSRLKGVYTSYWQEGTVETSCSFSLSSLELHVDTTEEGSDYEHHMHDMVCLDVGGLKTPLAAEDGEITDVCRRSFYKLLLKNPAYSAFHEKIRQALNA